MSNTEQQIKRIQEKLQLLLKLAGAREDAKVSAGSCTEIGGQPDRFASAKLVFHTLAPAESGKAEEAIATQWRKVRIDDSLELSLIALDPDAARIQSLRHAAEAADVRVECHQPLNRRSHSY
mgnify:CR=1 FL=1